MYTSVKKTDIAHPYSRHCFYPQSTDICTICHGFESVVKYSKTSHLYRKLANIQIWLLWHRTHQYLLTLLGSVTGFQKHRHEVVPWVMGKYKRCKWYLTAIPAIPWVMGRSIWSCWKTGLAMWFDSKKTFLLPVSLSSSDSSTSSTNLRLTWLRKSMKNDRLRFLLIW